MQMNTTVTAKTNSSDITVNECKLSWRTTRHSDGTTVPV